MVLNGPWTELAAWRADEVERLLNACPADLSPPFGVLDLADVSAFVTAFLDQNSAADLAEPIGRLRPRRHCGLHLLVLRRLPLTWRQALATRR